MNGKPMMGGLMNNACFLCSTEAVLGMYYNKHLVAFCQKCGDFYKKAIQLGESEAKNQHQHFESLMDAERARHNGYPHWDTIRANAEKKAGPKCKIDMCYKLVYNLFELCSDHCQVKDDGQDISEFIK
jgi:hypothetical protein